MITALAVVLTGCATAGEKTVEKLNLQVSELRKSLDETNARLEDLTNKFQLLREKLDVSSGDEWSSSTGESFAPPAGLKVVRLGEDSPGNDPVKAGAQKDPKALYSRGQDLLMSGRHSEARALFQELLDTGRAGPLSDNALYWMGESYYAEREYRLALEKFNEVVERFPSGNKAPDALLKAAYSYMEMKERAKAEESFRALIERYPKSEAAEKARASLRKITGER